MNEEKIEDKYKMFRDKLGRFTKGNPGSSGRPKGTYVWLFAKEFKEKYSFLNIVTPNACPDCGGKEYRFNVRWDNKRAYTVRCRCNKCNRMRWYKQYQNSW